jgi:pSer/pThr/pTyr-binding forkhead associated (FHA) protein
MQNKDNDKTVIGGVSLNFIYSIISAEDKHYTIEDKVIVGRGTDCDVLIDDKKMSRNHANLVVKDGRLQLTDLNSSNGTFVNGKKISEPTNLLNGDSIAFEKNIYSVKIEIKENEVVEEKQEVVEEDNDHTSIVEMSDEYFHKLNKAVESFEAPKKQEVPVAEKLDVGYTPEPVSPVVTDKPIAAEALVDNKPKAIEPVVAEKPKLSEPVVAEKPKPPEPVVAEKPKPPEPVVAEKPKPPEPVVAEKPKTPEPVAPKAVEPVAAHAPSSSEKDKKDIPSSWIEDSAPVDGTRMMDLSELNALRESMSAEKEVTSNDSSVSRLHCFIEGQAEEIIELAISDYNQASGWEIGRDPQCDIVLDHPSVSNRHAQIVHQTGRWKMVNLVSTNGIVINGQKKLTSYLSDGDKIGLGSVDLVFKASKSTPKAAKKSIKPASQSTSKMPVIPILLGLILIVLATLIYLYMK